MSRAAQAGRGALARQLRRLRAAAGRGEGSHPAEPAAAPPGAIANGNGCPGPGSEGGRPQGPPAGAAAGASDPFAGVEPRSGRRAGAVCPDPAAAAHRPFGMGAEATPLGGGPPAAGETGGSPQQGGATPTGTVRPPSVSEEPRAIPDRSAGQRALATGSSPPWRLMALPVCASTEVELDRWLERLVPGREDPLPGPMAVIARRQRFGRGQQGRLWSSPAGGVWLSAALPWPADPAVAAAPGLAVAVGLALQLEGLGLEVRLKWPNDLLIAGSAGRPAKLAGLLPRLRLRGTAIRWAGVGLGLNGTNRVPAGASNLMQALGPWGAQPRRLTARVLQALEWAMAVADQAERVRQLAEQRLLVAPQSWQGAAEGWQPIGLASDGALLLARGEERRRLLRRFD